MCIQMARKDSGFEFFELPGLQGECRGGPGTGSRAGDVTYQGKFRKFTSYTSYSLSSSVSRYQREHSRPGACPRGPGGSAELWNTGSVPSFSEEHRSQKNPGNAAAKCRLIPQALQETRKHFLCKQGADSPKLTLVMSAAETGIFSIFLGLAHHGSRCSKMQSSLDLRASQPFFGQYSSCT